MSVNAKSLIERLSGEENARRTAFIALAVDHTLAQPVRDFVHFEDIADVLTEALTDANAEKLIAEELHPMRQRVLEHFQATKETPRDLLPPRVPERVIAIVAKGNRPRAAWAKGAVDVAPIRGLLSPIVQDVLLSFSKKLPIPGLGGEAPAAQEKPSRSGGLLGSALRKSAGSIADMGKAALGNISGELEKKIQATTRDFSNQALGEIRSAIAERLQSDEGQKVIRDIRVSLIERFLDTPVHVIMDDANRAPVEALVGLVPDVLEHNRGRSQLRDFIQKEVEYQLATYGDRSVGELLDNYGLKSALRDRIVARIDRPVAQFIESPGFEAWLSDLLQS